MTYEQAIKIAEHAIMDKMRQYAFGANIYRRNKDINQLHQYEEYERLKQALGTLKQGRLI